MDSEWALRKRILPYLTRDPEELASLESLPLETLVNDLLDRHDRWHESQQTAMAVQSFNLEERIKELKVLFDCSTIVQKSDLSLSEMLNQLACTIPRAMVYDEDAYGVIQWGREVFTSHPEACSPLYIQEPLILRGQDVGRLTLGYFPQVEGRPHLFLEEERNLISVLAQHISRTIERMEAHRNLEESETKLRLLLDFIPTGLNLADASGTLVQSNRRAREILGMDDQAIRNRPVDSPQWNLIRKDGSLFPPEEFPSVVALRTGKAVENVEMGFPKGSAEIIWLLVSAIPTGIPGMDVAVSYIDITERVRMELELRQSEAGFRDLFELSQDVLVLSDLQGHILNCNAAALRMFGLGSLEEVRQFTAYDLYPDPGERDHLIQKLQSEGRVTNHEVTLRDPQGRTLVCLVSLALIQGRESGVTILTTLHDITLRKQAEMQLTGLNHELQLLVEEKAREILKRDQIVQTQSKLAAMGEMVSSIAHQWRQPLSTLSLIIQKYRLAHQCGELTEDSLLRSEEKALQLIAHMSQTINDFRFFYKPSESASDFSLKEGVSRACRIMEAAYRDLSITLETDLLVDGTAHGYLNDLTQVVLSLLENSRDIFQERRVAQPKVLVRTSQEGGNFVIIIRDNGGGIHPQVMPRIFEAYFTTRPKGTGMGLHLCKMILQSKFKGGIYAKNWEEGAEFRVEIPLGNTISPSLQSS